MSSVLAGRGITGPGMGRSAILSIILALALLHMAVPLAADGGGGGGPSSRAQVEEPVLLWPFDGMANGTLKPEFVFFANYTGAGGLTYKLQLAEDPEFADVVKTYASNLDGGFVALDVAGDTQPFTPGKRLSFEPFDDLTDGTVYWWRVQAVDLTSTGSDSEWSEGRSLGLDTTLVHHRWRQATADQLLSGEVHHLEAVTEGVTLGMTDVVLFRETFPSTDLNTTNWVTSNGPPTVDALGIHEPSEPYSLRLNGQIASGDRVRSRTIDLSEFSNGTIEIYWEAGGGANAPEAGDLLIVEVRLEDDSWVEAFSVDGNGTHMDTYVHEVIQLPEASFHEDFQFRLRNVADDAGDDWFVDDVEVKGSSYKVGSLTSGALRFSDGPPRRTGWAQASVVSQGDVTVAVQAWDGGAWTYTGLEGGPTQTTPLVIDLHALGNASSIRLVANFSSPLTSPILERWSIVWDRPATPFVRLLSPQPGEVLLVNYDYTIRWEAVEEEVPIAQNPVSILFSPDGRSGNFTPVVSGIANTGEYVWKVPNNQSKDCYLRIEVEDSRPVPMVGTDTNDGAFSIYISPPKVTLLTPNGGEALDAGSHHLIRWVTDPGSFGLTPLPIDIYMSVDGAAGNYKPIFEDLTDTGNISWKVPNEDSTTCFLKVVATGTGTGDGTIIAEDISDGQFTIRPDLVKPHVVVMSPTSNTDDYPPEKSIYITFNEEMDRGSTEAAFSIRPRATGDFVWYDNTMVFVPSQGLQEETSYTVMVDTGAKDRNGNSLVRNYETSFRTGMGQESTFDRWSFAIFSLFLVGLAVGISFGGWYLKKRDEEVREKVSKTVIDEIFLMSTSGKLIKHYTRRLKPDVDQDILSGMLVAVQNFVKDTFKGEAGHLDELTFGEFKILLARGMFVMIAAVVKGRDPDSMKDQLLDCIDDMERKQESVLKDWDGDSLRTQGIDPFMRGLIAGRYK